MAARTPPAGPREAFRLGPWIVRPDEGTVSGPEGCHRLEPRKMDLLVLLARESGRVVRKDEILETLWGDWFVAPGALTQSIHALRRILGDDPQSPRFIRTWHRLGYQLLVPAVRLGGQRESASEVSFAGGFAGREEELARLAVHLEQALAGRGRVALVTGEAGSGKTELVGEFARRSCTAQLRLLAAGGRCNAQAKAGNPYLPFREVLAELTGEIDGGWAGSCLGDLGCDRLLAALPQTAAALVRHGGTLLGTFVSPAQLADRTEAVAPAAPWLAALHTQADPRPLNPAIDEEGILEHYGRLVRELARERPLLLVLEDLHWADAGSASLLRHLAQTISRCPILIVASFRPEDLAVERRGERHPMAAVVNALQRTFGDFEIALDEAPGRPFLDAFLDSRPNRLGSSFRVALFERTRGHALFMAELLRSMEEGGMLVRDAEGRWTEGAGIDWDTLPERTEAVIAERVGRLPDHLRKILDLASVEGETFAAEVIAQALGLPQAVAVRHLSSELDRRHRLVSAETSRLVGGNRVSLYRFRHVLFQRFLYQHLDDIQRAYAHEAMGRALEELHRRDLADVAWSLARHFEVAGRPERAIEYRRLGGQRALRLGSNTEALVHFRRGLDLLPGLPDGPARRRLELELLIAQAAPLASLYGYTSQELAAALARARELSAEVGDSEHLTAVVYHLVGFHGTRGELQIATTAAAECWRRARRLRDRAAETLAVLLLGWLEFMRGRLRATEIIFRRFERVSDPVEDRALAAVIGYDPGIPTYGWWAWARWICGDAEGAEERSRLSLALAEEAAHPHGRAYGLLLRVGLLRLRGELQDMRRLTDELGVLAREERLPFYGAIAAFYDGWLEAGAGCADLAGAGIAKMTGAIAALEGASAKVHASCLKAGVAERSLAAGHLAEARRAVDEGLAHALETGERFWEPELHRLDGEVQLATGAEPEAAALRFRRSWSVARELGANTWAVRGWNCLARLELERRHPAGAAELLRSAHAELVGESSGPDVEAARALFAELEQQTG